MIWRSASVTRSPSAVVTHASSTTSADGRGCPSCSADEKLPVANQNPGDLVGRRDTAHASHVTGATRPARFS